MILRLACVGIALTVLAGCLPGPPAQILLEIDTDLLAPEEFDALEVRVYGNIRLDEGARVGRGRCGPEGPVARNGFAYTLTFCEEFSFRSPLASDRTGPLRELGVVPGSAQAAGDHVGFELVAYRGDDEVLRTFDHTQFPRSGPRSLRLFLARACLETVCDAGLTCRREGVCEEPERLDDPDSGILLDAGIATDAGLPPTTPDAAAPPECITTADCAPTSLGPWSACNYEAECDRSGTRSRSLTAHPCQAGVCGTQTSTENGACSRETNGDPCGGGSMTDLGTCGGFTSECDEDGSQTVHTVQQACGAESCIREVFDGMQPCSRETNGDPCNGGTTTSRTACSGFTTTCDESGTQTVTITESFCAAGDCTSDRSMFTVGCTRDTEGDSCGTCNECGASGACSVRVCGPGCGPC